jgi:hypothetical protein
MIVSGNVVMHLYFKAQYGEHHAAERQFVSSLVACMFLGRR